MLSLRPGGRLQVARSELAHAPQIDAWLEGLELRGVLRQSDPV